MKQLRNRRSVFSKVATMVIFIVGGLATAIGTFAALNQPALPMWSVLVAFVVLAAGCVFAGKKVAGVSAPWVYLVDVAISVLIGFAFLTMEEHITDDTWGVRIWRLILVFVVFFIVSGYFYKRHPSAPKPASEESSDK